MNTILSIALNTFREAVRDKVLYGIIFFAIIIILFSLVLGELSLHEEKRITIDIGLSGISLFSIIISVFLGVTLVRKELEKRTIYFIISKPISRAQFLIGKYFGMLWTVLIQILLMTSIYFLIIALNINVNLLYILISIIILLAIFLLCIFLLKLPVQIWSFIMGISSIIITGWLIKNLISLESIIQAIILISAEVTIIISIAILFSSITTPLLSGVITFGIFIAGRNIENLSLLYKKIESGFLLILLKGINEIVPNLYLFYPSGLIHEGEQISIHNTFIAWSIVGWDILYSIIYTIIILILSILIFRNRDFI